MSDIKAVEIDAWLAHGEQLGNLMAHPNWGAFEQLLHGMRLSALEELAETTQDRLSYWQGVAQAIAEILERPHRVVGEALSYRKSEEDEKSALARTLMEQAAMDDL